MIFSGVVLAVRAMKDYSVAMRDFILIMLLTCFVVFSSHAEVYRSVDEYGNVSYSDEPSRGAKEIEIYDAPIIDPDRIVPEQPPNPASENDSVDEAVDSETQAEIADDTAVPNYELNIVTPPNGKAIRENAGNVMVSVSVSPDLDKERADKMLVYLDGVVRGKPRAGTIFKLKNVDRGAHTVRVDLVDKNGKVLTSASSAFQLHRHSIQHNKAN